MARRNSNFSLAIRTEGGLLPTDFLLNLSTLSREIEGLGSEQYHLSDREKINEAINRAYSRLQGFWLSFKDALEKLPAEDYATSPTKEKWLLPLFDCLGYGRLVSAEPITVGDRQYKPSHIREHVPIHLVGYRVDLDKRSTAGGARTSSPHSLVQELLNQSDDHLWAFVSNGRKLRILRDNVSLTRQAFIEFDLESIFEGDGYSDFRLLWLLCHQSRVDGTPPESCWLEKWKDAAQRSGVRVRDQLRLGVEKALEILGTGFLRHRANDSLRSKVMNGEVPANEYYQQLLRLIYRLLFLFVTEDKDVLLRADATIAQRTTYYDFYSTTRLRAVAGKRRGTLHEDLWTNLSFIFEKLCGDTGCPELGLPAVGSFLWSRGATPVFDGCRLYNLDLLEGLRHLCFTIESGIRRPVQYGQLESEELGSIYESLLEQVPYLDATASFSLRQAPGSERKTTGSYYTPTSLVNCLLDSALEPVLNKAAKSSSAEEAILNLKVCDPACGSGHFLIAAAHRIAKRLATARSGDLEPGPEYTNKALRDVISRCIFGVDVNEMAVELCKVSLWLQSAMPGVPLSFLDHKIRCGNSLFGTTPSLIEKGLPDAVFDFLEGDDKEFLKRIRSANKKQTDSFTLAGFLKHDTDGFNHIGQDLTNLDSSPDVSVADVHFKEESYRKILDSGAYSHQKFIYDSWCAAFAWKKSPAAPPPITRETFGRIRSDVCNILPSVQNEVLRLRKLFKFFHWHIEFPQIFSSEHESTTPAENMPSRGFDVVLGNPPWERIKLQQREWFASRAIDIATEQTAESRRLSIGELDVADPTLKNEFLAAQRLADTESLFYRKSGRYPLGAAGDTNTYPLFLELSLSALKPTGRCGMIVKTGILADYNMRDFFSDLIATKRLVCAHDFSNKKLIFPAVVANERFTLLTVCGRSGWDGDITVSILNEQVEDVSTDGHTWQIKPDEVRLVNPNTLTCPLFQSEQDAQITLRIYQRLAILLKEGGDQPHNQFKCEYLRMFDMTNDSKHFFDLETLLSKSSESPSPRWRAGDGLFLALNEGKLFDHFDHRYGTFEGIPRQKRFGVKAEPNHPGDEDKRNPTFVTLPRHWMPEEVVKPRLAEYENPPGLLAFRDVCRTHTDSRTVRACIVPPLPAGNKAPVVMFPGLPLKEHCRRSLLLCANLCSFVLDFVARQKFAGGSLNRYILLQLPVVELHTYSEPCPWNTDLRLDAWIIERAIELSYTSYELAEFAKELGFDRKPFEWEPERRFLIRCELDAAFFLLYGVSGLEAEYILDSFRIVRDREIEVHGEFRSKKVIMETLQTLQKTSSMGTVI